MLGAEVEREVEPCARALDLRNYRGTSEDLSRRTNLLTCTGCFESIPIM